MCSLLPLRPQTNRWFPKHPGGNKPLLEPSSKHSTTSFRLYGSLTIIPLERYVSPMHVLQRQHNDNDQRGQQSILSLE